MEKKHRVKYDLTLLQKLAKENNATVKGEYPTLNNNSFITFYCKCLQESTRKFKNIVQYSGMKCNSCIIKEKSKYSNDYSNRHFYNLNCLQKILKRDNATLVGTYNKINARSLITFNCNCGKQNTKKMFSLYKSVGAFCNTCSTNRIFYNTERLTELFSQSTSKLIGEYRNVSKNSRITFQCKCGKTETKDFFILITSSGGCKCYDCAKTIGRKKFKETNLELFGGHPMYDETIKEKLKTTNILRYGVDCVLKNIEIKDKIMKHHLQKYGCHHTKVKEIKDKIKQTNFKKYGVEVPTQSKEVQEKAQKNMTKYKNYTMPSGEIRRVQGYEPFALDELILLHNEKDIITKRSDIPRIKYKIGEKEKYYFPDIYLPKENKIIEVKSTYTYTFKHSNIEEKKKATIAEGYNYEIWIYTNKKIKTIQ